MPTRTAAPGRSLRAHIVALVASALLPAFAVGALAVGAAVDSYRLTCPLKSGPPMR